MLILVYKLCFCLQVLTWGSLLLVCDFLFHNTLSVTEFTKLAVAWRQNEELELFGPVALPEKAWYLPVVIFESS